jgi:hypothetical protein
VKTEIATVTCTVLVVNLLLNFLLIINKGAYYHLGWFLSSASIIFSIMNLTLGMVDKNIFKARYIWTTILINIFTFTTYLSLADLLNPSKNVVKVVIVLNYLLLEIFFIYKRIVIKDTFSIQQVKNEKHSRYIKQDAIVALVITSVVILIAKLYDNESIYVGRIGGMVSEILGPPFFSVAIVTHVHTFARYIYNIKSNNKF